MRLIITLDNIRKEFQVPNDCEIEIIDHPEFNNPGKIPSIENFHNKFYTYSYSDLCNRYCYICTLVVEGQKLQAIKEYRQMTGLGLKESYDFVQELISLLAVNKHV